MSKSLPPFYFVKRGVVMADTIDSLQIEINAKATKANDAIDRLVGKLDRLTTSISKIDTVKISNLANSIGKIGTSSQANAENIKNIASSIKKISNINYSQLYSVSNAITNLSLGISSISNMTFDVEGLKNFANIISKFGNKISTQATANLPQIQRDLMLFIQGMNSIGNVNFDVSSLFNLISAIGKLGLKSTTQATANLPSMSAQLQNFIRQLNNIGALNFDTTNLANLINGISKLGGKSVTTAITNIPQLATALNSLMATLSRSPQVSQNVIQMTNALANLASQGSKVGSASNSMVRGLNRTATATKKAGSGFKGLAAYIGKFYATYFMVIRAFKGLWSSIESTADYIESYNYFNVALGKVGSDWSHQFEQYGYENAESYAESFSTRLSDKLSKLSGLNIELGPDGKGILTESNMKNLGLNIQEITQYASQLTSITNSIGLTGEASLAAASSFTKLAGDMSSLFNVDYSSAAKNLQSGLIGQSRALYKYGIDITNATLQTYAYNLGLSKSVSEMTQAEKMQLRMLAILDQSKVSWGDLANTINSPSNMIRQFKNNLKETGLVLGQLFIPVMQKVMPVINGVTIAIKRLLVSFAELMGVKIDLDAFGQGYTNLEDDIDGLTGSYEDAAKAAEEWKNQLLGFDEVNKLSEPSDSGSDVGAGGIDLTQQIIDATSEYEKAWQEAYEKMMSKSNEIADKIQRIFKKLKFGELIDSFKKINDGIGNIKTALKNFNKGIFKGFYDFVDTVITLSGGVLDIVAKGLTAISQALDGRNIEIFGRFGEIFGIFLATVTTYFGAALIITKICEAVKKLGAAVKIAMTGNYIGLLAAVLTTLGIALYQYFKEPFDVEIGVDVQEAVEKVQKLNSEFDSLRENFQTKIETIDTDFSAVETMAGKYFEMSQNYATLSDEEKTLLSFYAEELKKSLPDITGLIDEQTGAFTGSKEELNNIIEKTKTYYKTLAAKEYIVEAYKKQAEAEKQLAEIEKIHEEKLQAYNEASRKLRLAQGKDGAVIGTTKQIRAATKEWNTAKEELDAVSDQIETLNGIVKTSTEDIEYWENQISNTKTSTDRAKEGLKNFANSILDIGNSSETSGDALVSNFTSASNKVSSVFGSMLDAMKKTSGEKSTQIGAEIGNNITSGAENTVNAKSSSMWDKIRSVFDNNGLYNSAANSGNTLGEKIMSGVSGAIEDNKPNLWDKIKSAFNGIEVTVGATTAGISLMTNFPKFATGGFPEDGLFYKNSDEIITQVGGKTQVLNREDTHDMIKQAAYEGMLMAMSQSSNNTNVNVVLQGDADGLFKVVQNKANNYTVQTGRPAFLV